MIGFEKTSIDSFLNKFLTSDVTCCLFHLSKNINKEVIKIGLKQRYHGDDYSLKVRCLSALAFHLIHDAMEAFEELTDDDQFPQDVVSYF